MYRGGRSRFFMGWRGWTDVGLQLRLAVSIALCTEFALGIERGVLSRKEWQCLVGGRRPTSRITVVHTLRDNLSLETVRYEVYIPAGNSFF